jgi:hypothetical protein
MNSNVAYNPLDKINLAKSIESELLTRHINPLASVDHIVGAGVYVIYYTGPFSAYSVVAHANQHGKFSQPIYVGKAIPKGGRKGGLSRDVAATGRALADRLRQHASSIDEADNLDLAHFHVRHLVVDDIWIPLGENMLIETFKPIWNRPIDGFGNKDPGKRRSNQFRSPWDVLHPGRLFANKLGKSPLSVEFLNQRIDDYCAGRPLAKLPKIVVDQQAEQQEDAEEAADQV